MVKRNWQMKVSRRMFNRAAVAAVMVLSGWRADDGLAETASGAVEPVVLARALSVVLAARETHVALMPVPVRRRPAPKRKPKAAKPAPPRMQLVLRDIVWRGQAVGYDVFLVLEGPNVFKATETRMHVGMLEQTGEAATSDKPMTVVLEANEAFAKFGKIRGFDIRRLRAAIVRRAVKGEDGKASPDRAPTEIGAIELVRA
jgi:hypothetical protein